MQITRDRATELSIMTGRFKQAQSRERMAQQRLLAAMKLERGDRAKVSSQYFKKYLDMRHEADAFSTELFRERNARVSNVKGEKKRAV